MATKQKSIILLSFLLIFLFLTLQKPLCVLGGGGIDPSFGKTTIGASQAQAGYTYVEGTNYQTGSDAEGASLDSITLYCAVAGNDIRVGIYELASNSQTADPTNLLYGSPVFTPVVGWNKYDIPTESKPTLHASTWYHLSWRVGGTTAKFRYDSGVANSGKYRSIYGSINEAWLSSYGTAISWAVNWSIYGNYTTAGEEGEYSYTFTETLKPSATLNQWQEQYILYMEIMYPSATLSYSQEILYIYSETVTAAETITYRQERIYVFTQTLNPSETLTFWQEQLYTLSETLASTATFQHGIEGLQAFVETLTETLSPSESIFYWQERIYIFNEPSVLSTVLSHAAEGAVMFFEYAFSETIEMKDTSFLWVTHPLLPPSTLTFKVGLAIGVALLLIGLVISTGRKKK